MFLASPKTDLNTSPLGAFRVIACFHIGMTATISHIIRIALQRYLDGGLGVILVLAGGLKGQQLLVNPSEG